MQQVISLYFEPAFAVGCQAEFGLDSVDIELIPIRMQTEKGYPVAVDFGCMPSDDAAIDAYVDCARTLRNEIKCENPGTLAPGNEQWIVAEPLSWQGKGAAFKKIFVTAGYLNVMVMSASAGIQKYLDCHFRSDFNENNVGSRGVVCAEFRDGCIWANYTRGRLGKSRKFGSIADLAIWMRDPEGSGSICEDGSLSILAIYGSDLNDQVVTDIACALPSVRLIMDEGMVEQGLCRLAPFKKRQQMLDYFFCRAFRNLNGAEQAMRDVYSLAYDKFCEEILGFVDYAKGSGPHHAPIQDRAEIVMYMIEWRIKNALGAMSELLSNELHTKIVGSRGITDGKTLAVTDIGIKILMNDNPFVKAWMCSKIRTNPGDTFAGVGARILGGGLMHHRNVVDTIADILFFGYCGDALFMSVRQKVQELLKSGREQVYMGCEVAVNEKWRQLRRISVGDWIVEDCAFEEDSNCQVGG